MICLKHNYACLATVICSKAIDYKFNMNLAQVLMFTAILRQITKRTVDVVNLTYDRVNGKRISKQT